MNALLILVKHFYFGISGRYGVCKERKIDDGLYHGFIFQWRARYEGLV